MITKEKCVKDTVRIWTWLAENPHIDSKRKIPDSVLRDAVDYPCYCPLCEYLYKDCYKCPLNYCQSEDNPYVQWRFPEEYTMDINNTCEIIRKKSALEIVERVKRWAKEA